MKPCGKRAMAERKGSGNGFVQYYQENESPATMTPATSHLAEPLRRIRRSENGSDLADHAVLERCKKG